MKAFTKFMLGASFMIALLAVAAVAEKHEAKAEKTKSVAGASQAAAATPATKTRKMDLLDASRLEAASVKKQVLQMKYETALANEIKPLEDELTALGKKYKLTDDDIVNPKTGEITSKAEVRAALAKIAKDKKGDNVPQDPPAQGGSATR